MGRKFLHFFCLSFLQTISFSQNPKLWFPLTKCVRRKRLQVKFNFLELIKIPHTKIPILLNMKLIQIMHFSASPFSLGNWKKGIYDDHKWRCQKHQWEKCVTSFKVKTGQEKKDERRKKKKKWKKKEERKKWKNKESLTNNH